MKILYKVSEDYMYEDVTLLDDEGKEIANFNTQADCPEDNNLSRMGVIANIQSIVKHFTGNEVELETADY
jgi:hypothetical protein